MEPIEGSETSVFRTQTPGNHPKENILHVAHGVLFCSDGNSYTASTPSDMCIYSLHIFHNIEKLSGKKKIKKLGEQ